MEEREDGENVSLSAAEDGPYRGCAVVQVLRLRSFRFVMYLGSKIGVVKLMK